jgi:hypothetical protein
LIRAARHSYRRLRQNQTHPLILYRQYGRNLESGGKAGTAYPAFLDQASFSGNAGKSIVQTGRVYAAIPPYWRNSAQVKACNTGNR